MVNFLYTKKTKIIGRGETPIILRGVNFGGWLMMEAYILYAPNFPERGFKKEFARVLGERSLQDFEKSFRSHFIREEDFKRVSQNGFNCIRVPFNCRLIEKGPYQYDLNGVKILDQVLAWGKKYKIYIILDLHAAPGAQNHDWHADSFGKAELWRNKEYQKRTYALWEFLADRYKEEEYLAGYDLLNEAVLEDTKLLNQFYKGVIKSIRGVDRHHILFIEGNRWAQDIESLEEFDDDNYVLSVHNYEPLAFTFNFVNHLHYPLKGKEHRWDKSIMERFLSRYKKISEKRGRPVYVGEFGVNYRRGHDGETQWLEDTLSCYKKFGFHWTYWTYKAIKNFIFPDGIFSYVHNPPWVNRSGPKTGWETFHRHWFNQKQQMVESWHTGNFEENRLVLKALKKYAR